METQELFMTNFFQGNYWTFQLKKRDTYLCFLHGHSISPCLIKESIQVTGARPCNTEKICWVKTQTNKDITHDLPMKVKSHPVTTKTYCGNQSLWSKGMKAIIWAFFSQVILKFYSLTARWILAKFVRHIKHQKPNAYYLNPSCL